MQHTNSRCAVMIVNYGSSDLIGANMRALAEGWLDLHVIVVDNFSTVDERARVKALCDIRGWTAILLDENTGFGAGVNAGAEAGLASAADVLIVLNPDASLAVVDAEKLAAAAASDTSALVAPIVRRSDGSLWTEGVDLYLDDGSMAGVRFRGLHTARPREFWVSGACFAVSRELWERIGGFDDEYFLYWEDVDLSRKVREAGGTVRVLATAIAVHDEGGTHDDRSGGRGKSETYYYYNIRNRLLFARRHLSAVENRRWRRSALRVSWRILLQGGRRQLVTSRAPWRALRRGLRDGFRGVTGPAPR